MPQLVRSNVKRLLRTVQNESIPNAQRLPGKQADAVTINLSASPESTPEQSDAEAPDSPELVITSEKPKAARANLKGSGNGSKLSAPHSGANGKSSSRATHSGRKRKITEAQISSEHGLEDDRDDVFQRPSQRVRVGYGKSSQRRTQSSQSGSQLKNIHGDEEEVKKQKQRAVFQLPEDIPSPPRASHKQLKAYAPPSPSRTKAAKPTFSSPPSADIDTQTRRLKAEFKTFGALEDRVDRRRSPEFDTSIATEGTFLSSLSSTKAIDVELLDNEAELIVDTPGSPVAEGYIRCPMCNEHVVQSLVNVQEPGELRSFRDKMRFCDAHKRRKAEELWTTRNYPTISWERLPKRLTKLRRDISSIIERREISFYHDELEKRLESGRNRKAIHILEGETSYVQRPGYYGSKGGTIIMDHIMKEYSDRIRRQTTKDRVLQLIGVSGYVQAVLLPEVACLLVKTDMNVDDEGARAILEESAEVGDLLHEDETEAREVREELLEVAEREPI